MADHISRFIDGLTDYRLREKVRCNDYGAERNLKQIRDYAAKTWQAMEAEEHCRRQSRNTFSTGYQRGGRAIRWQRFRGTSRGRGGARGRGGRSWGNRQNSIAAFVASHPRGRGGGRGRGGRGRARSASRQTGRQSSRPSRSESRGPRSRFPSAGNQRSASAGRNRSSTPKRINAVDSDEKREEAIREIKRLRLKSCVGCMMDTHVFSIYFRDCLDFCVFCKKKFDKNQKRHFAVLCNKIPKTRKEILDKVWAAKEGLED